MSEWILCEDKLPTMHDAGILKKVGVNKISDECIITVVSNGEYITETQARLRDGRWHNDFLRFLDAGKKDYKVIAWMPLPEPYKKEQEHE